MWRESCPSSKTPLRITITMKPTKCTGHFTSGENNGKPQQIIFFVARYIGQKKYEELQSMLYDGAVLLFTHEEVASGTDLAKLYIDTLNEAEAVPEEIHFTRIAK